MTLILVSYPISHGDPICSDNELEIFGKMVTTFYIGDMTYKKYSTPYSGCVFPRDSMTALTLLSYLYLENHSVKPTGGIDNGPCAAEEISTYWSP